MTDTKWTPGPWYVIDSYGPKTIGPNAGNRVCAISGTASMLPETEANATLIAAAPELYEALKRCVNLLGHIHTGEKSQFIDEINDILAKARGEDQ